MASRGELHNLKVHNCHFCPEVCISLVGAEQNQLVGSFVALTLPPRTLKPQRQRKRRASFLAVRIPRVCSVFFFEARRVGRCSEMDADCALHSSSVSHLAGPKNVGGRLVNHLAPPQLSVHGSRNGPNFVTASGCYLVLLCSLADQPFYSPLLERMVLCHLWSLNKERRPDVPGCHSIRRSA